MAKGSGSTTKRVTQTYTYKYDNDTSAKMMQKAHISTINIYDTEDNYSPQEKVDFILKTNEIMKSLGTDGLKVRSLDINSDGTLSIGSVGVKMKEGAFPSYATVRAHQEMGRYYYTVTYNDGNVKFDTTTLSDLKAQVNAQVSLKYTGAKNPFEGIHNTNAHVLNTKEERENVSKLASILSSIYVKKK